MFFTKRDQRIARILIVEDEPLIAFDNEHALVQAGYTVVATVDRFRDADALISSESQGERGVDLIIADIRLRGARSGSNLRAMPANWVLPCCSPPPPVPMRRATWALRSVCLPSPSSRAT